MKAYRQDFDAIATLVAGDADGVSRMSLGDITTDSLRTAFAQYAETHEAASIQRCWSTWNVLCTFLYTADLIGSNPMPMVGRPKLAKTLPKALPADAVTALLAALRSEPQPRRRTDWIERDRAVIVTALLAGLRR
jgi:integrase/recombinase XerC